MTAMKTPTANATRGSNDPAPDSDIAQRVKLLTRLRQLLLAQREKFRSYLRALERQGDAIRAGDVDQFEAHVQLEQSIVKDIISFRRAVEPMEDLYHQAVPAGSNNDIPELKAHLDHLQEQVLKRNGENRTELRRRMEELRSEVEQLRIPPKQSLYASSPTGGMVDITT